MTPKTELSPLPRMVYVALGQAVLMGADAAVALTLAAKGVAAYGPLAGGFLAFAAGIPWLVMSGFGGQLADWMTAHAWRRRGLVGLAAFTILAAAFILVSANVSGWAQVALWAVVTLGLGVAETVRNSLARLALLDLDTSGVARTRFARIDRASFQIGVTVGGLLGAVLIGLPLWAAAAVLAVSGILSCLVLALACPPERGRTRVVVKIAFRLLPPRGLPALLMSALLVLTAAGLLGQQRLVLWPVTADSLGGGPILGWMTAASAAAGLTALVLSFRTEGSLARTVVAGAFLFAAVSGMMALAVALGPATPVAVFLAVAAAGAHGLAAALLLVSTRQLAALLAPPGQVGEVSGWTSMPMNGFTVITGPLLAAACLVLPVTVVWMTLGVILAAMVAVLAPRLLTWSADVLVSDDN